MTSGQNIPGFDLISKLPPKPTLDALDARYGAIVPQGVAPLASPTFTGTVTVPTPTVSTAAANKSYVDTKVAAVTVTGGNGTQDLGYGGSFPTTRPDGSPLQDGDVYDFG